MNTNPVYVAVKMVGKGAVARTAPLIGDIVLADYDAQDELVGIEVMPAVSVEDNGMVRLDKLTAEQIARAIFMRLGYGGDDLQRVFVAEFAKTHRTLQQAFFRTVIQPVIEEMASDRQGTDMRNAAAKVYAENALAVNHDAYLPFI